MGWNSWDCYGAAVNEEQLLGNAQYMADHLLEYGWEYVVCDIQWYEPKAKDNDYNNFTELCMDEYSRLIPAENRFPSSADGKGFKPIADKIHSLGLKFGIHIMRGIPRQAVHRNTPILGSDKTAREIAHHFSVCPWNTDMYGIDASKEGAQEYYNSIFSMYADWGVDFVKVDDICNTEFRKDNPYSAKEEVELIRRAIDNTGRAMVLSLSPGPAQIEVAEHLKKYANMWRLTGDFWDDWSQLKAMFERCEKWEKYVGYGCWPDCDMIPLGRISKNGCCHGEKNRYTNFTKDEQISLMTLWCIFRSPLMFGGELRENDDFTNSLLTNNEVIDVNQNSSDGMQIYKDEQTVIRTAMAADDSLIVGIFNLVDNERDISFSTKYLGLYGNPLMRDLWEKKDLGEIGDKIETNIGAHGAKLFKFSY
ncbi:MAG: glycoside hydrolase family 27 protein [Clostridiales bacterium]|nr:glycoside hydrolase family 27 protein [Clostridiales bacterium]